MMMVFSAGGADSSDFSAGSSASWLSTVLPVGGSLETSSAETEKGSALNISTTASNIASILFLVCVMVFPFCSKKSGSHTHNGGVLVHRGRGSLIRLRKG